MYLYFLFLFLIAVVSRAYLMYSSGAIPEINGGYALVQVRSIFETGGLGISDLPLTFYLQASLAKIVTFFGISDTTAIWTIVRLFDVIVPALSVFGIGLSVLHILKNKEKNKKYLFTTLAIALGSLSIVPLSMVGNYMKNSLGLVWMSFFFYFLFLWKSQATRKNSI